MRKTAKAQFVTGTLKGVAPSVRLVGAPYDVGKPGIGPL